MGIIGRYAFQHLSFSPDLRMDVTVAFFGAFTTFSTFGWETMRMLEDGEWMRASLYVGASVIGGLILVRLGMRLGEMI